MNFRLANGKKLFLAGLALGALPFWARAQSLGPEQQILFSTPEGQIVSNTAIPVASAPQPLDMEDLPAAPVSVFNPQLPQPKLPAPLPNYAPQGIMPTKEADSMDTMDPRKDWKILTPAQIMGVPTMQQIFGLPDSSTPNGLKNPALAQSEGSTNIFISDESSADEPTWAKTLAANNSDEKAPGPGKTARSHGLLDEFFNGPPNDGFFGNQDKNADGFGPAPGEETAGQSPFSASLAAATLANPASTPSAPGMVPGSGLSSPSPLVLPQSSGLETLPQLPAPPSVPGQSYNQPPPAPPSWAPKPAPWLLPVPPAGTMEPRKF